MITKETKIVKKSDIAKGSIIEKRTTIVRFLGIRIYKVIETDDFNS